MAGVICVANTTAELALASSSARWVLRLHTAANRPIKIKEWGVFFDNLLSTAEPALVCLARCSSDGTMTGFDPKERTITGMTIQTSAAYAVSAVSSESGWGNILAMREIHTQTGYQEKFGYGDEILLGSSQYIGINVNSPSTCDVVAEIVFEE